MKNLFDFATKELSQDAFLRWLFENFNDDGIGACSCEMLRTLCDLDKNSVITEVSTVAQWQKIDITVKFKVDNINHILFIEDKTFSEAHDQLNNYGEKILKYCSKYKCHKVFYKTSEITVKDKNEAQTTDWKIFGIEEIFNFFKGYSNTSNIILKQYIQHIELLYTASQNRIKPTSNNSWADWVAWISFFEKEVVPKYDKKYIVGTEKIAQYPYVYFYVQTEKNKPYLEIRSRDCCGDEFVARILCYQVNDFSPQARVIDKIKKDNVFNCKNMRKKDEHYKQIGIYIAQGVIDNETFFKQVEKCVDYYADIMEKWDNVTEE